MLNKAMAADPAYEEPFFFYGALLLREERCQEAVKELEQALNLQPKHPHPHLLLSQVYFRMGDEQRAREEKEISRRLRRADPTIMEVPQGRPFPADAR